MLTKFLDSINKSIWKMQDNMAAASIPQHRRTPFQRLVGMATVLSAPLADTLNFH